MYYIVLEGIGSLPRNASHGSKVTAFGNKLNITIGGHRHRSQCRRYPTSDINICYSDIGDKYVGLKNVIPISEVFRYRHQSSFRYPTLKKKKISACRFEPTTLRMVSERYDTKLLWLPKQFRMSDIRENFIPISYIMSDSALSVRYRKFRYQA
jgi:hypothetical protein